MSNAAENAGGRTAPGARWIAWIAAVFALAAPLVARADTGGARSTGGGSPITPALAQKIYDRLAPLHESDGCRLERFDTKQFLILVDMRTAKGGTLSMQLASAVGRPDAVRSAGGWALVYAPDLAAECAATLTAIEAALREVVMPQSLAGRIAAEAVDRSVNERAPGAPASPSTLSDKLLALVLLNWVAFVHALLVVSVVLLFAGSLHVLWREAWRTPSAPAPMIVLLVVWVAGLALRLLFSPQTFLHEYFHVGEMIRAYLEGRQPGAYGEVGPALFQAVGDLLGRPSDVQVVFVTNAVIASLAIPALGLLDLALLGSWPRAICSAVLLCVLPLHLRFSAAEDMTIQATTFGIWAVALFALYLRTRRWEDALLAVLALSVATQTRPEMILFPLAVAALVPLAAPRSWRVLVSRRTLAAALVLAILLIPRLVDFYRALQDAPAPQAQVPAFSYVWSHLVFFYPEVTPWVFPALLGLGLIADGWRRPGVQAWALTVYLGFAAFALSMFGNRPWTLRSQILPTSFLVLACAGVASLWMWAWGATRRRAAALTGVCALAALGATVVWGSRAFVRELRDQQLQWAFLERTVPTLPARGTLLTAVESGGPKLDAFPSFLLDRTGMLYDLVDVRLAAAGEVRWPDPAPGEELIYYQGMFCHFAFSGEPAPNPITPACAAVHAHYELEPLAVEELPGPGYSELPYAGDGNGPFRIGFFRAKALR